jgi:cell division septation protein DedD
MSDESRHEFKLNPKQLVFLFMSSTVVAVVIFLCGVMVGRGVSAAQSAAVPSSTVEIGDPTAGDVPAVQPAASTPSAAPLDVAPDAPGDEPDFKYPTALTDDTVKPDLEAPKPAAKPAPVRPASVVKTNAAAATVQTSSRPVAALNSEPAGAGFVVQVAATPKRAEAEAIQSRLEKKGYPAFVTTAGRVFRVRVGKYKDRAEATSIAKRLETQERFKPWVTR